MANYINELKYAINSEISKLEKSYEEEARCKDSYDDEGYAMAYQNSKAILKRIAALENSVNRVLAVVAA